MSAYAKADISKKLPHAAERKGQSYSLNLCLNRMLFASAG